MKRARSASPESRTISSFSFLELLPEMRGEVVGWLVDMDDRVALARTCKTLLAEINPPKLPRPWRFAWTMIKTGRVGKASPLLILAFQDALVQLIAAGVPQWAGIFRNAYLVPVCDVDYHLAMQWAWGTRDRPRITLTFPVEQVPKWRFQGLPYTEHDSVMELSELLVKHGESWRTVVASRRLPYIALAGSWDIDEDTPAPE